MLSVTPIRLNELSPVSSLSCSNTNNTAHHSCILSPGCLQTKSRDILCRALVKLGQCQISKIDTIYRQSGEFETVLSPRWAWSRSRDLFIYWQISVNISKTVQDTDILTIEDKQEVCMAYRMAATAVTSNDLQGHSPVVGLFMCNPSNTCAAFYTISTDSVLARFLYISRASSDIRALWRSVLSTRVPECRILKMVGQPCMAKCTNLRSWTLQGYTITETINRVIQ